MSVMGNTVKLRCEFVTWAGTYTDPTSITLKIYDRNRVVLNTYTIDGSNKISTGVYEKDYTIPSGYGDLTYEFAGTLEGTTTLGRATILREWVDEEAI
jgi:hypothetical protein